MLSAVTNDILQTPGFDVHCLIERENAKYLSDACIKTFRDDSATPFCQLQTIAKQADWIWLIAPELDRILDQCLQVVEPVRHKLISPDRESSKLATDKFSIQACLTRRGVPCIPTAMLDESNGDLPFELPVVIKPNDGAGSADVRLIRQSSDWQSIPFQERQWLCQPLMDGMFASVSVFCGSAPKYLVPTKQVLDADRFGAYLGSAILEDSELVKRGRTLARSVVEAIPGFRGHVGIDMILGNDSSGKDDYFVELNPRLTSSCHELRNKLGVNFFRETMAALGSDP